MKTLQIVGNSSYGGASYLIVKWCAFLRDRGVDVHVLVTHPEMVSVIETIPGVRVISNILIPRDIVAIQDIRAFVRLRSLLLRENFDVVHTYTSTPGVLGRIAARLAGVPVILHHQAGWTVTEFSSAWERLAYTPTEYLATLFSTRGICVSHAVARQAAELRIAPLRKLITICNGIDAEPFVRAAAGGENRRVRDKLGLGRETLVIGGIGRLAEHKDNATILRAVAQVRRALRRPIALVLVGSGPERENLEQCARALGLTDVTRFLGFRRDIPSLLPVFDIFASASLREGLSIAILEAMAAARPIVATSIPPNLELVEHEKTGLAVPPRAPRVMASAILRFAREPEFARACGVNAQQRALSCYSLDQMLQETWDLYLRLLSERDGKQSGRASRA